MGGQRGIVVTWGIAEGILIYRSARARVPPRPGALLATSGAFILLALLAEAAPQLAVTIAVGIDIAAAFQAWPGSTGPDLNALPDAVSHPGGTAP